MKTTALLLGATLAGTASAQTVTQVPLDYNFNGIVHAGEAGLPDDPMGYRSISDRGIDFSGGVPNTAALSPYAIVSTAGALDIVHIGNRNTVAGGGVAFQPTANGDNIGTQPAWLANPDQSTPQTTTLTSPIALTGISEASFLLQASNGGGSIDVVFGFQGGATTSATVGVGDWFGGSLLGTAGVDSASASGNLNVQERTVDLSAFSGQSLTSITFQDPSTANAGFAVLACNVSTGLAAETATPIALDYNFNGIVHAGESSDPDNLDGYRSISDRGLDFTAGVPANTVSDGFVFVQDPFVVDLVHLGNRETVDGGSKPFDPAPDGDNLGVQPTWLPTVDQSTPQTTTLAMPMPIGGNGRLDVLFQISNGGGDFTVRVDLASGGSISNVLSGPDWFGGTFPGVGNIDLAAPDANLNLTVDSVDLSSAAGDAITAITFQGASNANGGIAIFAANLVSEGIGANYCTAVANSTGSAAGISAQGSNTASQNDVTLTATGVPPLQFGIFLTSETQASTPVASGTLCVGGNIVRFQGPGQIQQADPSGTFSLQIDTQALPAGVPTPIMPGETWNFTAWFRDIDPMVGNTANFSNGIAVTFN